MSNFRNLSIVAFSLALALGASSCGDDNKEEKGNQPKGSQHPNLAPIDGGLENAEGAITSLVNVTCRPDGSGMWAGTGQLVNETDEMQTYFVRFSVVDPKNGNVLGFGEDLFDVEGHGKKKVSFTNLYQQKVPVAKKKGKGKGAKAGGRATSKQPQVECGQRVTAGDRP